MDGSAYNNFTETRQYNALVQLTRITDTGQDIEYVFSGTQNNGRILQTINHTSGETVAYSYDTLNRLLTAGSTSGK